MTGFAWQNESDAKTRGSARVDFGLSEEQELLQETVRSLVAKECPPGRLRELFDAGAG